VAESLVNNANKQQIDDSLKRILVGDASAKNIRLVTTMAIKMGM